MPKNEGERIWQAWQRYQGLGKYRPDEPYPFLQAQAAVKNLFVGGHFFGDAPIPATPDELAAVYFDRMAEISPGVADDAQRNLKIMGSLVGRSCALQLVDARSPDDIWPTRGHISLRYRVSEPVEVISSGLEVSLRGVQNATMNYIAPMIEVMAPDGYEDANLPLNFSRTGYHTFAYAWQRVRGITVLE